MPGNSNTVRKVSKYGVISGPYFPVLGLNTEKYFVSLCIQSECGKIRTRNNSVFEHFSRSVYDTLLFLKLFLKQFLFLLFLKRYEMIKNH